MQQGYCHLRKLALLTQGQHTVVRQVTVCVTRLGVPEVATRGITSTVYRPGFLWYALVLLMSVHDASAHVHVFCAYVSHWLHGGGPSQGVECAVRVSYARGPSCLHVCCVAHCAAKAY